MSPDIMALLFLAALFAGFVDAVAGGGGLIAVPALLWAGLPPQLVLGTNKMQSSFGTLLTVRRYLQAKLVVWEDVRLAAGITFASAVAGALSVAQISNSFLKQLVPWLLLAVAVYALITPRFGLVQGRARWSAPVFAVVVGTLLGFYDGFFGPGAGSFWTMACLSLLGLELTRATAYTKVVNLASNVGSLLVFVILDCVRYDVALVMIAGQLIGARLGSGLVIRHGAPFVRVVFLLVVFALVIKLLADQV